MGTGLKNGGLLFLLIFLLHFGSFLSLLGTGGRGKEGVTLSVQHRQEPSGSRSCQNHNNPCIPRPLLGGAIARFLFPRLVLQCAEADTVTQKSCLPLPQQLPVILWGVLSTWDLLLCSFPFGFDVFGLACFLD